MTWRRRSHKQAKARADEAKQLREQAELAEADTAARVRLPMARLRQENHVVADIIHLIRKEPG